jgi:hypothetical protein
VYENTNNTVSIYATCCDYEGDKDNENIMKARMAGVSGQQLFENDLQEDETGVENVELIKPLPGVQKTGKIFTMIK